MGSFETPWVDGAPEYRAVSNDADSEGAIRRNDFGAVIIAFVVREPIRTAESTELRLFSG